MALLVIALLLAQRPDPPPAAPSLDYVFFKERVQPIFLQKRPGHVRCVTCHDHRSPLLQPLAPGAGGWTEEQSRRNFAMWKQFVVPGNPIKSPMLLHPLAEAAGGDRFHAGGKHWKSQSDPEWQTLAAWVSSQTVPAPGGAVRVLQTNAAGDDIHVIDPASQSVVAVIEDIEVPHGVAIAPDGTRIYVSDEALTTLDVVDARTLKVVKRIPLSGRPNNVDVAKDGAHVYVGIRQPPGAVDVIDTASLSNVKSVPVKGEIHNVYVTPDGRHVVAGSIAASTISVIDSATHTLAWTLTLSAGIRPMAFTRNPDGSTRQIIVQLSDFHGFAVVDFAARKEVRRITLPDPPGEEKETQGLQGSPSHGLAITPDGKMLWATSKYYHSVAAYSLPDFKLLKVVKVGLHPDWLTITPDGRNLYVAVAGEDTTVVVDNKTMKVVKTIPVGSVPKRNASGVLRTN
ncbi:MAG: beta-propeller fold lactonase family protein [Acidobacteria bacterium]|nr:beta-propeller fold lactonase family protein [Acidobacteriota bacterium]